MNTKQEKLANDIIELHKENGGTLNIDMLCAKIDFSPPMDRVIILDALVERGFLNFIDDSKYRTLLTELGFAFEGFEYERKAKVHLEEKERNDFEKSKIDLVLAKKMLKEYPYTKLISWISFIIGVCLAVLEIKKALAVD
jgi:hypothetical protein